MFPANLQSGLSSLPRHPGLAAACRQILLSAAAFAVLAGPAEATAITFSIDFQGPTNGVPDAFSGIPIDEGSILTPFPPGPVGPNPAAPGPLPPPGMMVNSLAPPAPATGRGLVITPTPLGFVELDALSFGADPLDSPSPSSDAHHVFSVDEFAIGLPGSAVRAEGAIGALEASADTFTVPKTNLPTPPIPGVNAPFTDGDGLAPSGAPGVGLIEPNPPTFGSYVPPAGPAPDQRDPGDNLDALDLGTSFAQVVSGPIYFSLDSQFADPLETALGPPGPNTGTAVANGFVGGDVLVNPAPGGPNVVFAPATSLGLDLFGTDTDDLDALKLNVNATDGYQASQVPFDWLTGASDMLLFSVRRDSAIIGTLDSIFGISIEEGDILTTPCPAGSLIPGTPILCVGGGTPGIFVAAESLGLATVRSGTFASYGVINPQYNADVWADDLDAYDQVIPDIPEPSTLLLFSTALAGLGFGAAARRRARSRHLPPSAH